MPIEHFGCADEGINGATLALVTSVDYVSGEIASQLGIGHSGLKVLGILNRIEGMTAGELAKAVDLTSGSMTATLDRLEVKGLVVRRPSETDRRSITVLISLDGKQAMGWVLHQYRSALSSALESIPEADHEGVARYLTSAASSIRSIADEVPYLSREA